MHSRRWNLLPLEPCQSFDHGHLGPIPSRPEQSAPQLGRMEKHARRVVLLSPVDMVEDDRQSVSHGNSMWI